MGAEAEAPGPGIGTGLMLAVVLLVSALAGALGGAGLRAIQDRGGDETAALRPPVLVLSVAEALRAGQDAAAIRGLAQRLADGGFLVLDAQAVLAAPRALSLAELSQSGREAR
jgi:hypothetical protein